MKLMCVRKYNTNTIYEFTLTLKCNLFIFNISFNSSVNAMKKS